MAYFVCPIPNCSLLFQFMLTYMPRDKVRHEYVSVTPDGFRFRRQNFETLNLLMKWFKVRL